MTVFNYKSTFLLLVGFLLSSTLVLADKGLEEKETNAAFLGVITKEISDTKMEILGFNTKYGEYISLVYPNSPAAKGGLTIFDYIVEVDGRKLNRQRRLSDALSYYQAGDKVSITYIRNGMTKDTKVELARRSDVREPTRPTRNESAYLGIRQSSDYSYSREKGVKVNVVRGTAASEMQLRNGDIIFSIDGYRMVDWNDITTILDYKRAGQKVLIKYYRQGKLYSTNGMLKSAVDMEMAKGSSGKKGSAFLGINVGSMNQSKAENIGLDNQYGSYVSRVYSGSAAEKYGIQPMDYLYGINVYRAGEDQRFGKILSKFNPGEEADVYLVRKGKREVVKVVFGERSGKVVIEQTRNDCERPFLGVTESRTKSDAGLIVNIVPGSPADGLGLRNEDMITRINGHYIIDWIDLKMLHSMYSPGDRMEIEFIRDGKKLKVKGSFTSYKVAKNCDSCDCSGRVSVVINEELRKTEEQLSEFEVEMRNFEKELEQELKGIQEELEGMVEGIRIEIGDSEFGVKGQRSKKGTELMPLEDKDKAAVYQALKEKKKGGQLDISKFSVQGLENSIFYGIYFESPERGDIRVKVASSDGRIIYDFEGADFEGAFEDRIDLAQENDIYYFLIQQNGKDTVRKVRLK